MSSFAANVNRSNHVALGVLSQLDQFSRTVIVLCGLPGSGKSTFSRNLLNAMDEETRQRWTVLNQDALKSRQRVWEEANKSLEYGKNVIIDRCNFDASQRKHWIDLAYNHEVYSIVAITILDQNFESCVERATTRGDDGIHDGDTDWSQVCGSMDSQFTLPVLEEGFSAVYDCNSQEDKDTIARAVVEFAMREPL